jgi:8-oxo-dGTP diphosphatase/2-hydroxy-dATP diphosphatase
MRPQWFSIAPTGNDDIQDIPYAKMWDDDQHWLPLLISGQKFVGRADFKCTGEVYTQNKWWFGDPV